MTDRSSEQTDKVQGEGDYESARKFNKKQHKFAKRDDVMDKAEEAAHALDGDEGKELEEARRKSRGGESL